MGYIETKFVKNGDGYTPIQIFECDRCKKILQENYPHYKNKTSIYCVDCAFILDKITEREYLFNLPIIVENLHAEVIEGEIVVWTGNIHPLDKKRNKLDRRCKQYQEWRKNVFKRDNYKCTKCNSEIDLEAHHIKEFSKYKKLRFDIDNGITLCKMCHRNLHRKRKL